MLCPGHSWRAAPDGLVSCEHCGKIYVEEPNFATWGPAPILRCECGGAAAGYPDFAPGHAHWCPVREA
jgi:hypothetical protein